MESTSRRSIWMLTRPRAAAAYRSLIAADPNDSEVYAGLGEAELGPVR